jgi:hypothetical protein
MAKAKATKAKTKAKNPLGIAPYDPADYLRTPKEVAMYLEAFFEDGVDHEALKRWCMRSVSSLERAAACQNSPGKPAYRAGAV